MSMIPAALIAVIVLLDIAATVKVIRENEGPPTKIGSFVDDPRPRRWGQTAMVWLLPVVGALIVFNLYSTRRRRAQGGIQNPSDPHPYVTLGGP